MQKNTRRKKLSEINEEINIRKEKGKKKWQQSRKIWQNISE